MKTTQHTPFKLGRSGDGVRTIVQPRANADLVIAELRQPDYCETEEMAQFIVTACNAHYELLEALKLAETTIERVAKRHGPFSSADGTLGVIRGAIARAAIQSAQGKSVT